MKGTARIATTAAFMIGLPVIAMVDEAGAFPFFNSCEGCHSPESGHMKVSDTGSLFNGQQVFNVEPGGAVDLSVDVLDGDATYAVALLGLATSGISFVADPNWVLQSGGYYTSTTWPGTVQTVSFHLAVDPVTPEDFYPLEMVVAGGGGGLPTWSESETFYVEVFAHTLSWNTADGNWENASAWSFSILPEPARNALIGNGSGLRGAGGALGRALLHTPAETAGSLTLGASGGEAGWLVFDQDDGDLAIEGLSGDAIIGKAGIGAVDLLRSGSSLTIGNRLVLGEQPTGLGDFIMTAGTLTVGTTGLERNLVIGGEGEGQFHQSGGVASIANTTIIGDRGTGSLDLQGGGVFSNVDGFIAKQPGATGSVTLSGTGSTWTNLGSLYVGGDENAGGGTGALVIGVGATLQVNGKLGIWGPGTVTLDGGTLTTDTLQLAGGTFDWVAGTLNLTGTGFTIDGSSFQIDATRSLSISADFVAGDAADGQVTISGGGVLQSASGFIAKQPGATGSVVVQGPGSNWSNTGSLYVGGSDQTEGGTAHLAVETGATVDVSGPLKIWGGGTVELDGGALHVGSLEMAGGSFDFRRGAFSIAADVLITPGHVIVTAPMTTGKHLAIAGTTTLQTELTIDGGTFSTGALVGSEFLVFNSGTLEFTGPGFTVAGGGPLGDALTVRDGQHFNSTGSANVAADGFIVVEQGSFSAGTLTNDGEIQLTTSMSMITGGTLINNGLVRGRGRITASLDNAAAGEIRGEADRRLLFTVSGGVNHGTIDLFGGTVEFTQDLTNAAGGFIAGRGILRARGGITNDGTMAFSAGTTDIHGDVNNATGSQIVISGGATATFFDDLVHNGAEIRVSAGSSAVFFGDVSGAGPFTGGGTTFFEGDLRPGNSPSELSFEGDVVFGFAGGLDVEIGGLVPGDQFDVVQIGGEVVLDGTLDVELLDGFLPSPGDRFEFLRFGSRRGTFVGYAGLDIGNGLRLGPVFGENSLTLVVTAVPEPCCFVLLCIGVLGASIPFRRSRRI